MKVWSVQPITIKSAYAVCVLAENEKEAIEKAKRGKLFYLIEPFGPEFKAVSEMDAAKEVVGVWFDEYNKGESNE